MKKLSFFALLALFTGNLFAQTDTIYNENNVLIVAKLIKVEEQKNKDAYTMAVKVSNLNDYDLFYSVDGQKTANGFEFKAIETKGFSAIEVKNGTGFFGDFCHLIGKQTNYFTDNSILFKFSAKSNSSFEKDFKVEKGVKPQLRYKHLRDLLKLSDFSITNIESLVDGSYTSSCGNINFNLTFKSGSIIQFVNGNNISWLTTGKNQFSKADKSATIIFNPALSTFLFTSNDGISCTWKKLN